MNATSIAGFVAVIVTLSLSAQAFSRKKSEAPAPTPSVSEPPNPTEAGAADTVWVQKPDGSRSCEAGSGKSIESAADELQKAGVNVLEKNKTNDGKMHAQMCGLDTGKTNAYRIRKADLPRALSLGYSVASGR